MRTLVRSVLGLVIIILLASTVALFLIWSSVPDMVAINLARQLKVGVNIGDIDIGWDTISVDKFDINNPKGSVLTKALSAKSMEIDCPLKRYFARHVVIDTVTVNDVYVSFEFDSTDSIHGNWTTLMTNYMRSPKSAKKSHRRAVIKRLVLNNISADLVYRNEGSKVRTLQHIDQIVLLDVTSTGGLPVHQLMGTALGQSIKHIAVQEHIKDMLIDLIEFPPLGVMEFIELPFKGLFGK